MNCDDIVKYKLILSEWNAFYFIEIAFIGFTLHQIKQCIVFFWDTWYIIYLYASSTKIVIWNSIFLRVGNVLLKNA